MIEKNNKVTKVKKNSIESNQSTNKKSLLINESLNKMNIDDEADVAVEGEDEIKDNESEKFDAMFDVTQTTSLQLQKSNEQKLQQLLTIQEQEQSDNEHDDETETETKEFKKTTVVKKGKGKQVSNLNKT